MLEIWTIYDHPRDFPDSFVARKFVQDKPTDEFLVAGTLTEVRKILQNLSDQSLHWIPRLPDDDSCIVESWF
ncbi:MAG: hypothetical protein WC856_13745 [Methylococcaceae bacterium]|jgi:hypothetical protein